MKSYIYIVHFTFTLYYITQLYISATLLHAPQYHEIYGWWNLYGSITIPRPLLTWLSKWSLDCYPASFLIFVERLLHITGGEHSLDVTVRLDGYQSVVQVGGSLGSPVGSAHWPLIAVRSAPTPTAGAPADIGRPTPGRSGHQMCCPNVGVDGMERCSRVQSRWLPAAGMSGSESAAWSATSSALVLEQREPTGASPRGNPYPGDDEYRSTARSHPALHRTITSDTQGLLGQWESGEECRAAVLFWGCHAAARLHSQPNGDVLYWGMTNAIKLWLRLLNNDYWGMPSNEKWLPALSAGSTEESRTRRESSVLRSSSRQPLTLVGRQRGDAEATSRGVSSWGPGGAGAEATSQGGPSGGSEMALENSGEDGVPNTSDGRQASLRHERMLRGRDGASGDGPVRCARFTVMFHVGRGGHRDPGRCSIFKPSAHVHVGNDAKKVLP